LAGFAGEGDREVGDLEDRTTGRGAATAHRGGADVGHRADLPAASGPRCRASGCGGRVGSSQRAREEWAVGSSASRRPSPTKFTPSTKRISSPPGNRNSHGNVSAEFVPSRMSVPSDTSGGWTPKPKYDSPVSARMTPPTLIV